MTDPCAATKLPAELPSNPLLWAKAWLDSVARLANENGEQVEPNTQPNSEPESEASDAMAQRLAELEERLRILERRGGDIESG